MFRLLKKHVVASTVGLALLFTVIIAATVVILIVAMQDDFKAHWQAKKLQTNAYMALEPTELAKREIPPDMLEIFMEAQDYYDVPWTVLAALAKHKSSFGKLKFRNQYGIFAVTAEWWSGKGAKRYSLDPEYNVENGGWGINEYDYPNNEKEIERARRHNDRCYEKNDENVEDCLVNVPDPIHTADPLDNRDATMAMARYLGMNEFSQNPRDALTKLLGLRAVANKVISIAHSYGNLVERSTVPSYYFADNQILKKYIPIYQEAARKYNIPWLLVAAIHRVETTFSTKQNMVSSVGAEGHMQFMPCTWIGWSHPSCKGPGKGKFTEEQKKDPAFISRYGGMGVDANGDGKADMWDIEDAVHAAAKYLARNGAARGDIERAILAYNNSQEYLSKVMHYYLTYQDGYVAVDELGGANYNLVWPVDPPYEITSHYGYRTHPVTGEPSTFHEGTDVIGPKSIRAIANGRVVFAGYGVTGSGYGNLGNVVAIDHGNGIYSLYAHLADRSIKVKMGDYVAQGTVIGTMGATGRVTGVHLHFEIRFNSPKRGGNSVAANPVCVYKAVSKNMGNQHAEWTSVIAGMGPHRLQNCN